MTTFYLILYIYAGGLARGDSVALQSIPMPSLAACQEAGKAAEVLVKATAKDLRFICIHGKNTP